MRQRLHEIGDLTDRRGTGCEVEKHPEGIAKAAAFCCSCYSFAFPEDFHDILLE